MRRILDEIKLAAKEKRHSPYMPISAYESPVFLTAMNRISVLFVCFALIVNYLAAYLSTSECCVDILEFLRMHATRIDSVSVRFIDLQRHDAVSGLQYIGLMWTSLVIAILYGAVSTGAYVRFVLLPGNFTPCDSRAIPFFATFSLLIMALTWVVFFFPTDLSTSRYLGYQIYFRWPIFPGFAGLGAIVFGVYLYAIFGTLSKIAFQMKQA